MSMVRMLVVRLKQLHFSLDYLLISRLIIDDFVVVEVFEQKLKKVIVKMIANNS
jgi:hypothetical protein